MKEKELVKLVLDYLKLRNVFCWRNNTGGFIRTYAKKDGSKGSHFYRFGEVGSSDILAVKDGKIYGIECKGKGGKVSESQLEFGKKLEEAGGIYVVAYKIEDVQRIGL